MKKILCIVALLMLVLTSKGQTSLGEFTTFPDKKLFGLAYKPQIAIGKLDNEYIICLRYVSPKSYASFDKESVLLLRLNNDSIIKLAIIPELEITKKYDNSYNKYSGMSHFYITYSYYSINESVLNLIVKDRAEIKKIRASFTNGDVEDWDISQSYQTKLTKGLIDSFKQVEISNAVRKEKINNVESGF